MESLYHIQIGFNPDMQEWFNTEKSINVIHHVNRLKDRNHMINSTIGKKSLKANILPC